MAHHPAVRHRIYLVAHCLVCATEKIALLWRISGRCATEKGYFVAHRRLCATERWWVPHPSTRLEISGHILWRTQPAAPQKCRVLWRIILVRHRNTTFCGAPSFVRHRIQYFCGALSSVRHRMSHFCGARGLVRHRKGVADLKKVVRM